MPSASRCVDRDARRWSLEGEVTATNEDVALVRREKTRALTWRGPVLRLVARSTFAVVAHALVAIIFAVRSSCHGRTRTVDAGIRNVERCRNRSRR